VDGNVRVWDARTYREIAVLAHGKRVLGLALSKEGYPLGDRLR
jgi:hypothetical protein